MSRINFSLSRAEHEKSFITSDTEELVFCMIHELGNTYAVNVARQQNNFDTIVYDDKLM